MQEWLHEFISIPVTAVVPVSMQAYTIYLLETVVKIMLIISPLLLSVAYLTFGRT